MSDEWQAYVKDPRSICKYGVKCYQKNPDHHKKFKHPPVNKRKNAYRTPDRKRFKPSPEPTDNENSEITESNETTSNTVKDDGNHSSDELNNVPSTSTDSSDVNCTITVPKSVTYYNSTDHGKIEELFLVEMPKDFFDFYKCLKRDDCFEKTLAGVNLQLIGPYDLLLGRLPVLDEKDLYLVHWRFFYDPPEFQAVLKKKGKSQYHIGYFRDSPDEPPVFLASNDSCKDCRITPMAENIFGAVYLYLQSEKKSSPFVSVACQKLMDQVKTWAEAHKYSLNEYNMKKRLAQTVTKSFHGAGIAVPYNKKTQLGYRKLVETDVKIKKIFTKLESANSHAEKEKILSELQPVITYASIAVDECDFGTGLELGINLFCSGLKELERSVLSSLCSVYPLLKRDAFAKIIKVHIKYRRKGPNMSLLNDEN